MAFASPLRTAFVATALFTACSAGDNDEVGATEPPITTVEATNATTTAEPTTTTLDETSSSSTTDVPTPTTSGTTESADTSTSSVDPTTGDTGSSDDTGPICDPGQPNCVCDGDICVEGYVCIAGVCTAAGLDCPADVEPPGESEANPVELGNITDDDDEFFDETSVLSGSGDVDWYHYHGADVILHTAEPTLTLVAGMPRVCQFIVCDEGGAALTTVTCPAGTDFAISPTLRPGCCGAKTFTIKDFGCPGNDDSVEVWLRIDKAPVDMCYDYNFKVHF